MAYTPTTWVDETGVGDGTIINAARLNNIESGIVAVAPPTFAVPAFEGAAQPGVLLSSDCALTVNTTAQVTISAGTFYVRDAAGVTVRTTPTSTVLGAIPVAVNNRIDQAVVNSAGAVTRLQGTTDVAGNTLALNPSTGGGRATIPAGSQRLHDMQVTSGGVLLANTRDRRSWARGAQARYLSTSDTLTAIGGAGAELTASRMRLECTGNPILAVVRALGNQTSSLSGRSAVMVDGVQHPGSAGGGAPLAPINGVWTALTHTFLLEGIAAGSHLFSAVFYNGSATGTFSVSGGSVDPLSLILCEQVAGIANNGTA